MSLPLFPPKLYASPNTLSVVVKSVSNIWPVLINRSSEESRFLSNGLKAQLSTIGVTLDGPDAANSTKVSASASSAADCADAANVLLEDADDSDPAAFDSDVAALVSETNAAASLADASDALVAARPSLARAAEAELPAAVWLAVALCCDKSAASAEASAFSLAVLAASLASTTVRSWWPRTRISPSIKSSRLVPPMWPRMSISRFTAIVESAVPWPVTNCHAFVEVTVPAAQPPNCWNWMVISVLKFL